MPRKRVWLFVVEGETDKTAIGLPMEDLIKNEMVEFDVFSSDIFGETQYWAGADPIMRVKDICERVRKEIVDYLRSVDYMWKDLDRVVLLLDTDGSFVSENLVVENDQVEHICYLSDHIEAPNASQTRRRIAERSHNVRKMIDRGHVTYDKKSVPVEVYFFSRNLEHALYDRSEDLTERIKARLANEFRSIYKANPAGFSQLIVNELAVPGDYRGTWNYVCEGTHSLERGSNLHLLLQRMSSSDGSNGDGSTGKE